MSTHAVIGVKFPDGEISGCYVHYDGATMAPRIVDYLRKNTTTGLVVLINQAQAAGGIRSFHCPPLNVLIGGDDSPTTDFLNDDEPYVIDRESWYDDHYGANYMYLVDYETGTVSMNSKY